MEGFLEFGERLKTILSCLNITNNQLARGINVDPSLVSRWINSKRVPPYNSNHIRNIAKFISNSITNSQHERSITEVMYILSSNKKNDKFKKIEDRLEDILLVGQEYSIEHRKDVTAKVSSKYFGKNFPEKEFALAGDSSDILSDISDINMSNHMLCNECVIVGEKNILSSIVDVLSKASKFNGEHTEPILFILNNGLELFLNNQHFNNLIEKLLLQVLKNRWKVVIALLLRDEKKSNLKIINFIQKFIIYENFRVFYFKESNPYTMGIDVVIVPKTGAIVCFCLSDNSHYIFDNAFYFKSQKAVDTLLHHYYKSISYSSPLVADRFYSRDIFYCKSKTENMNRLGNQYFYSYGIDSSTIPIALYKKYLKMFSLSKAEFEKKAKYHEDVLQTFNSSIKMYACKRIYIKEYIENLIAKVNFVLVDGYPTQLEHELDKNDVIEYINHIIYLLKNHDNYEIALISKKNKNMLPNFFFETRGISSIYISTSSSFESTELNTSGNQEVAFSFLINEPIIVKAVNNLFIDTWKEIPEIDKSKNNVIAWLENSLNNLL